MSDSKSNCTGSERDQKKGAYRLISLSADLAGTTAGAAMGYMLAGPAGAMAGGASGVIIKEALLAAGNDLAARILSHREERRIGATIAVAADKTRQRIEAGDIPRADEYINNGSDRPPVVEVTEGLLIAAQKAYEEKKVPYIGRLCANLNFRSDLDVFAASLLTSLANELSYSQLCLLRLAGEEENHKRLQGGKVVDKRTKGPAHMALLSQMLHLKDRALVNFGNAAFVISMLDIDPPAMKLQGYGIHLMDLMELSLIPKSDLEPIRQVLS